MIYSSKTGPSYERCYHLDYIGQFLAGDAYPLYKIEQLKNLHTLVDNQQVALCHYEVP